MMESERLKILIVLVKEITLDRALAVLAGGAKSLLGNSGGVPWSEAL